MSKYLLFPLFFVGLIVVGERLLFLNDHVFNSIETEMSVEELALICKKEQGKNMVLEVSGSYARCGNFFPFAKTYQLLSFI